MKPYLRRLVIVYIGIFTLIHLSQCASIGKIRPEYKGIDSKAAHFIKEYKELAKMQGIEFNREVTVGFKKINDGSTVGLTTYGPGWREIDLDIDFWNKSTEMTKFTLVAHEATHAYCDRDHDWGSGTKYPEYEDWNGKRPVEGRYNDGTECPLSIMYPVILDDFCVLTHYTDYMTEMFNRCKIW